MGRGLSELQKSILEMALANRALEWEPRPRAHRVLVFDQPEDVDLRTAVPEAFERFPDGYWLGKARYHLIAASLEQEEDAKRFAGELEGRGLQSYYQWTVCRVNTDEICDLFADEVYCQLYGMLPGANVMGSRGMAPLPEGFPGARIARQWRNTHTNDGVPNYKNSRHASARAAVSRAFVRLEARGLLKRDPNVYGVWLTVEGVQAAKELSVNRDDNRTSVSRYRLAEITR